MPISGEVPHAQTEIMVRYIIRLNETAILLKLIHGRVVNNQFNPGLETSR
jgi:hypothetical protein